MKAMIVIDMQNDFTTGVLGNPECAAVIQPVAEHIRAFRKENPDGILAATLDTHTADYMNTQEGKKLPVPHCIKPNVGWQLVPEIKKALGKNCIFVEKGTFGAGNLPQALGAVPDEIELVGVCTDICVISNAMIMKAAFPEVPVKVKADCCAGVTPESHKTALKAMEACQIDVL